MVCADKPLHVGQHVVFLLAQALRAIAALAGPNAGSPTRGMKPYPNFPTQCFLVNIGHGFERGFSVGRMRDK